MTITFVATKKSNLRPDAAGLEFIWEAGDVFPMSLSIGAILEYAGSEDERHHQKVPFGTAGMKCAHKGLIGTVLQAYNKHHNLALRPDDVWNTILIQLCAYTSSRRDQLRSKFSLFRKGITKLTVTTSATNKIQDSFDCEWFERAMLENLSQTVCDLEFESWMSPGFSTTTARDKLCAMATAVSTTSKTDIPFDPRSTCGIPKVTLEGTVDDWVRLREKLAKLETFNVPEEDGFSSFDQWLMALDYICENFVVSSRTGSTNNLDFWHAVVRRGGESGESYLDGWVSIFSFYDSSGQRFQQFENLTLDGMKRNEWPQIAIALVNPNIVSFPLVLVTGGDNLKREARLFVGQMSFDIFDHPDDSQTRDDFNKDLAEEEKKMRKRFVPRNDWVLIVHREPNSEL